MHAGEIVGERFEIERAAGSGAMGSVYRAKDRVSGAPVALKVLHSFRMDDHSLERFARESSVLAELRHPGIVGYVAHGTSRGHGLYLAMEWLDGENLQQRLVRAPLSIEDAMTFLRGVAEALGCAHASGIVHRDVKPSNLFLVGCDVAHPKILDFGAARLRAKIDLTVTGAVVGTPAYMAPEQARGDRAVGVSADVFALGSVLYKCLTGHAPFAGGDVMTVLLKVVLDEAPRVRSLRPDVPSLLDALVARMLAKDPAARPRDASSVARALGKIASRADATKSTPREAKTPSEPPRNETLTGAERRVMCVMLARPIARAADLDPASGDPTVLLDEQRRGLRAVLEEHRCHVDILADGSVLVTPAALSGEIRSAESAAAVQSIAAARAAIALSPHLAGVRLAIVAGRGEMQGGTPMGEVIERGVRLLDATEHAGAILVDDVVAAFLRGRFELVPSGSASLVMGEIESVGGARTLLGKVTRCVGRDRDIAAMIALFDECVAEPAARAALVIAPAGAGKTRVAHEVVSALAARGVATIWSARGEAVGQRAPLSIAGELVRRAAGIAGGEPLTDQHRKLSSLAARAAPEGEAARVAMFLAEIAAAPFPAEASVELHAARFDRELMRDQTRRAFEDLVASACASGPLVIVLEDLHWGDLASVRLIEAALRHAREKSLFVFALARPEIRDAFPGLWAEASATEWRLAPLTKKAAERLVRQVLGDVGDELLATMIDRAGGNAFFLEELVRAVAEGRGDELPATVLAMVQARLEGLHPEARRVLRAASIFGEAFWTGGVNAMLGGDDAPTFARDWFTELVERELLVTRDRSRFANEQELAFRHALVREAAYATLTDRDRAVGHSIAASFLASRGEREASILADHCERGGDRPRAARHYAHAAEQALAADDLAGAIAHAARGVACGATGSLLGEIRATEAEARRWLGDLAPAQELSLRALEEVSEASPSFYAALGTAGEASSRLGDHAHIDWLVGRLELLVAERGRSPALIAAAVRLMHPAVFGGRLDLLDRLLALLPAEGDVATASDPSTAARVHEGRAIQSYYREEDPAGYVRHAALSIEAFERAGDLRSAGVQKVNSASVLIELGAYEAAERALSAALAVARRMGMVSITSGAVPASLGLAIAMRGAPEEGEAIVREGLELAIARKSRRDQAGVCLYLAILLQRRGEVAEAEQVATIAIEMASDASPGLAPPALAVRASIRLARSDAAGALADASAAMKFVDENGPPEERESLVRVVYAEALAARGDRAGAAKAIAAARDRLEVRAGKMQDAELRASFLRVPENARTLALAKDWLEEERRDP